MPRRAVSEERLVEQLVVLESKCREIRKKLQVLRIRKAAQKRKAVFASIRRNEKEVLEVLKTKAPDFFNKLVTVPASPRRSLRAKRFGK